MADKNEFEDEYQFSELQEPNQEIKPSTTTAAQNTASSARAGGTIKETNVRRNALIVLGAVVFIMILYKFIGAFMMSKKLANTEKTAQSQTVAVNSMPVVSPTAVPDAQVEVAPAPQVSPTQDTETTQQLAALQMAQQNLRRDIDALNNQVTGMSSQLTELSTKIAQLTTSMSNLASTVESQAQKTQALMAKPKAVKPVAYKPRTVMTYSIQAIIPGRAWLIASNGSTITVREGTLIPGYGAVKLVDPAQGQVLTSTGKVIKFSQLDS